MTDLASASKPAASPTVGISDSESSQSAASMSSKTVLVSFNERSRKVSFIDGDGHKDLKEKTLRKFSDVLGQGVTLSEIYFQMQDINWIGAPYVDIMDDDNVPDRSSLRLCVSNKTTETVSVSCTYYIVGPLPSNFYDKLLATGDPWVIIA